MRTVCLLMLAAAPQAFAVSGGAPAGVSGAPGESTCVGCHAAAANAGSGNVSITLPQTTWKAGEKYKVTVTISDPSARRWGFSLTARQGANKTQMAGSLAALDTTAQVIRDGATQYATHTLAGTRRGTAGPVTFDVEWTAPAAGAGGVTFYVAANAANNNGTNDPGDLIYTSTKDVAEEAGGGGPTIRPTQPALQSWGGRTDFSSNSYLEIYGANFGGGACASGGRVWQGSDFNGPNAPTSLAGTSVTVNGKPAFIYFVCDGQININTPDDPATGPVAVQVRTAAGLGNVVNVNKAAVSPALLTGSAFLIDGKQYVIAQIANTATLVGKPGLIAGVTFQAVKPGDSITLYALGLGPTNPATQAGVINAANGNVTLPLQVRIGGQAAQVTFAAAPAGTIGHYQINVVVPNIGAGDQPIELLINNVSNAQNLFLSNP